MTRRGLLAAGVGLALAGEGRTATAASLVAAPAESDRWKIYESASGKEVRWSDLPGRLKSENVIFLGEQHDDPQTHRVELALLEALHKQFGDNLVLGMEMFERDQQKALDDYLAGTTDEEGFGKAAKPWSNYKTDYRPLVEFAKGKRLKVVGTNAPQRLVRQVGREGLATLEKASAEDKAFLAGYILAPEGDAYHKRFTEVMGGGHGDSRPMEPAMIARFYQAQCVRDDTMAESIVGQLKAGRTVFHVNGSFHSDEGQGTAARVRWRSPSQTRITVITAVPSREKAPTLDTETRQRGDYIIFVPDERPARK
jgi:uncharacterized iron-regulated protein